MHWWQFIVCRVIKEIERASLKSILKQIRKLLRSFKYIVLHKKKITHILKLQQCLVFRIIHYYNQRLHNKHIRPLTFKNSLSHQVITSDGNINPTYQMVYLICCNPNKRKHNIIAIEIKQYSNFYLVRPILYSLILYTGDLGSFASYYSQMAAHSMVIILVFFVVNLLMSSGQPSLDEW